MKRMRKEDEEIESTYTHTQKKITYKPNKWEKNAKELWQWKWKGDDDDKSSNYILLYFILCLSYN